MIILFEKVGKKEWILKENEKIQITAKDARKLINLKKLLESIQKYQIDISKPFFNKRNFPAINISLKQIK